MYLSSRVKKYFPQCRLRVATDHLFLSLKWNVVICFVSWRFIFHPGREVVYHPFLREIIIHLPISSWCL